MIDTLSEKLELLSSSDEDKRRMILLLLSDLDDEINKARDGQTGIKWDEIESSIISLRDWALAKVATMPEFRREEKADYRDLAFRLDQVIGVITGRLK